MKLVRTAEESGADTYYLRLLLLRKYVTRLKIVMAGATGLFLFIGNNLVNDWQKIVAIAIIFMILGIGYSALIGFDDAIVDVEYKLNDSKEIGNAQVTSTHRWPKTDEILYQVSFLLTVLTAFALLTCMVYKFNKHDDKFNKRNDKQVKNIRNLTTEFSIGPFVQGFDTLYSDSVRYKLNQLKDSLVKPGRNFTELNIYGGVDKRPLKGLSKRFFGDNITLAQARAEWVKKQIVGFNTVSKSCQFFTGISGAKKYAEKYTDEDYAISRYVIINCRFQDSTQANF